MCIPCWALPALEDEGATTPVVPQFRSRRLFEKYFISQSICAFGEVPRHAAEYEFEHADVGPTRFAAACPRSCL